jgi:hypothetical protein
MSGGAPLPSVARNTAVNRAASPASLISTARAADRAGADGTTSLTIGTKPSGADPIVCAGSAFTS